VTSQLRVPETNSRGLCDATEGLVKKDQKDDQTNLYTLTPLGKELIVERRQWEDDKLQATDLDFD